MKKLGRRIRVLREWRGLSLADLEKKTGIKIDYLAQIENNEQNVLTYSTIQKIAQGIGVSINELIEDSLQNPLPAPIIKIITSPSDDDILDIQESKCIAIPIISRINFFNQSCPSEDTSQEYALVNTDYIQRHGLANRYACFRVDPSDHSMAPAILPNSLVCLDLTQRDPVRLDGKIVLIKEGEENLMVRQLRMEGNLLLGIPHNISAYSPIVIPGNDKDAILGRVVWNWARIDE